MSCATRRHDISCHQRSAPERNACCRRLRHCCCSQAGALLQEGSGVCQPVSAANQEGRSPAARRRRWAPADGTRCLYACAHSLSAYVYDIRAMREGNRVGIAARRQQVKASRRRYDPPRHATPRHGVFATLPPPGKPSAYAMIHTRYATRKRSVMRRRRLRAQTAAEIEPAAVMKRARIRHTRNQHEP